MSDITTVPFDYIVKHTKTENIVSQDEHGDYVCDIETEYIPLVRCENCRKSHIDGKTTHYLWCTEWGRSTDVFGYCERGEREGE